ncbi:MAG: hypothetical protein M1823_004601 [Watsoniomyces obsoletus]|nr:MAG: hypothetical protein M1823_004601 [Watsoniomyces obsoletus]
MSLVPNPPRTPAKGGLGQSMLSGNFHSTVDVLVGSQEKRFTVHDALLREHSRFFQAALRGAFREAHEREVRLPDGDPEHFDLFLQWLYTQDLGHVRDAVEKINGGSYDIDRHFELLFHLYFSIGDALQVRALKNAIVDQTIHLVEHSSFVPCSQQVKQVFERTSPSNHLRRLIVDIHLWDVEKSFLEEHESWFDREFWRDMAFAGIAFRERPTGTIPPYVENPTSYHELC